MQQRIRAAIGSLIFFVMAPGTVAGLVPYWLTDGWQSAATHWYLRVPGALLIGAGLVVLIQAFVRFVVDGLGTPAPIAPTKHLVVSGLYRYVRNPMYVAIVAIIVGQALWFAHWGRSPTPRSHGPGRHFSCASTKSQPSLALSEPNMTSTGGMCPLGCLVYGRGTRYTDQFRQRKKTPQIGVL